VCCFFDFFLVKNGKMNGNKKINLIGKKKVPELFCLKTPVFVFLTEQLFFWCVKRKGIQVLNHLNIFLSNQAVVDREKG